MSEQPIREALASFDREIVRDHLDKAGEQRIEALSRFPLGAWPEMTLEQYAIGHEKEKDSFCYCMERGTPNLGSIRGGSSAKLIVYKKKTEPGWFFPSGFANEQEAWEAVRAGFVEAFDRASARDWVGIDQISVLWPGQALLIKALYLYFPNEVLPIASRDHLRHFLRMLGAPPADAHDLGAASLNQMLLSTLRATPGVEGWTTHDLERALYTLADPRQAVRLVLVTLGVLPRYLSPAISAEDRARLWEECARDEVIRVGWDEVGDLRQFDSKESFQQAFAERFEAGYKGHQPTITRQSNALWKLMELEPGDWVAASQGMNEILALGAVEAAGYEWREDLSGYRHTVKVRWDASYAKTVPPQRGWGTLPVVDLGGSLRDLILRQGQASPPPPQVFYEGPEPVFLDIERGLNWRGQVILYGPPGTGKTYVARRFAAWWLLKDEDPALASEALNDERALQRAERRLSSGQGRQRAWWVVANPKQWSWDELFTDGFVEYRYGRLQRNYPLVQPGDLVIGYEATPVKRIVALARVDRALASIDGAEPNIQLTPVTRIRDGLTYDEFTHDPIMAASEPVRFHCQGTLFGLNEAETGEVLSSLIDRNPEIEELLDTSTDGIHRLTRLTFHPSYSYEDFIEAYRPQEAATGGLSWRMTDGVFKKVCLEAQGRPSESFLVFIDEINRANVAKVFGEVITLLEKDKRGLTLTLPQSRDPFAIPPNVHILGTMNTADRSIKLLDAALRRRFAFVELMPKPELFEGKLVGGLISLEDLLVELNSRIVNREGREKQIGHSFFLKDGIPVTDPDEFSRAFRQEVLPLLQEYCYEDYGRLADYLGDHLVSRDTKELNREVLDDAEALVAALAAELGPSGQPAP